MPEALSSAPLWGSRTSGSQRAAAAQPQVVVVRADQHRAGEAAGGAGAEHAEDVLRRLPAPLEVDGDPGAVAAGEKVLAGRAGDRHHRQAGVARALDLEPRQRRLVRRAVAGRQVDDHEAHRAVLAGVERLVAQVGEPAFHFGVLEGLARGHEAAHRHQLARHVEPGVVVDAVLLRGDAIARGHHLGLDLALGRERRRTEVGPGDRHAVDRERGAGPHLHRRLDLEALAVGSILAGRLEAGGGELRGQPVGRGGQAPGADAAALARVVGQPGDVREEAVGAPRLGRRFARNPAGDEDVGLAFFRMAAVGGEGEELAVG